MSAPPLPKKWLEALTHPVKNRFFHGMLLNEHVLTRDQTFFESKRWLLNRLGLGKGVLSGLRYRTSKSKASLEGLAEHELLTDEAIPDDPESVWYVRLAPGVAVDGFGREIVVPSTVCARDLVFPIGIEGPDGKLIRATDAKPFVAAALQAINVKPADGNGGDGKQADANGPKPADGEGGPKAFFLLFEIAYDSRGTDPAPSLAGHCSSRCEPSAVREDFRVRFRPLKDCPAYECDRDRPEDEPKPKPDGDRAPTIVGAPCEEPPRSHPKWPPGALSDVFPREPPEDVRHRLLAQLHADLAAPAVPTESEDHADDCRPAESWVPLGLFKCELPAGKADELKLTHLGRFYRQLFSNDALSRLLVGLTERVDEAARVRVLVHNDPPAGCGEGQVADVYHKLKESLVVKVVDSTGKVPGKDDLDSIRVQFDRLTVSEKAQLLGTNDVAVAGPLDLAPDGTVRVKWKLGKRPGLHTVAARIVPKNTNSPPFHPGSQVLFHATARPTAPTVVGVFVDHLSCPDECGKHHWNVHGKPLLRLIFSRMLVFRHLIENLRVWAIRRRGEYGRVWKPWEITPEPCGEPRPVGYRDPRDREEVCWEVACELPDLVTSLAHKDRLRVAVLLRAPAQKANTLWAEASANFPQMQVLDPTFDGSFLVRDCRKELWANSPCLTDADKESLKEAENYRDDEFEQKCKPDDRETLAALWDRFQPRDRCLPSGDGVEGGTVEGDTVEGGTIEAGTDFHKTFEFRLPCC